MIHPEHPTCYGQDVSVQCQADALQKGVHSDGCRLRELYHPSNLHHLGDHVQGSKMNDLIRKHPMDGVRYTKPVRAKDDIKFLTRDEQRIFLEHAKRSHNYNQYALILETGLRTGELIGLTWDAINFEKRTLTVNKTLEFRYNSQTWRAGPPKTPQSYRTTGLTKFSKMSGRAVRIARSPLFCRKPWNIWIVVQDIHPSLSCVILSLSTIAPERRRRTALMMPICTSSATKQGSNNFVCTRSVTPMRPVPSKAECSRRCCKNCWSTPASKQPWIGTFTRRTKLWIKL